MNEWGRDDRAGYWPRRGPQATIGAILIALAVTVGAVMLQPRTPLQQYYLTAYIGSAIGARIHILPPMKYTLIRVTGKGAGKLALDSDVEPAGTEFTLSAEARAARFTGLDISRQRRDAASVHDLLETWIYGHSLGGLLLWPSLLGCIVLAGALVVAIPADKQRARDRRQGRRLKGPELVNPEQFTKLVRGDGIVLPQTRAGWLGIGRDRDAPPVILPRAADTNHILITGGTGSGKTVLIDEILEQADRNGETCVVYDPGGHFIKKFWRHERGDVHLNPSHVGCPYWPIGAEVQNETEALGIATALFPSRPHESNPFFTDSARAIVAHLLEYRPSVYELVGYLSNRHHLVKLLEARPGTIDNATLQDIMEEDAPAQKSGVMAALNLAAQSLKLCPRDQEFGVWSAYSWAQQRRGWVFLTNTSTTRARLVQLQSLWLDMIIMRLMEGHLGSHPVKIIADELPTLNRLPAMPTVLFEGRKSNISVVLGFQGDKQLEARYGPEYETMIAMCSTQIILKQNDGRAAKRASESIGEQEVDRLVESHQDGVFRAKSSSFSLQRQREPLVMASELSGLKNLRGYLKYGNLVTRLRFRYRERPDRCEGIIPKPALPAREVPDLTAAAPKIGPNPKPKKGGGRARFTTASQKQQPVLDISDPVHEEV